MYVPAFQVAEAGAGSQGVCPCTVSWTYISSVLFFCYSVIFLCTRNLLVGQSRCVKILALEHRYKLLNVERKGSKRPRENAPEVGDGDGEPAPKAGAKSKAKASAKKKKNEE